MKKVLIIGSGGREHALGWKIKQSAKVSQLFFAPGNGGTHQIGDNLNIKASEISKLLSFAKKYRIDLTVVGPEDPLALGIVDIFEKNKLKIFGPSKSATRLESSKVWAADFMDKYKIPHPISYCFNNYYDACSFFKYHKTSDFVIKANGLAAGKGVILPKSILEAQNVIKRMMINKDFGEAGKKIIIQKKIFGPEVSLMAFSDGNTIIPLLSAQDHKRIYDHDKGPNTGGMGAYVPVPLMTKNLIKNIKKSILQPTIVGMKREKCLYKGILYAGLMITKEGPKVLEYNARFGDPETQPLMMLLETDLVELMLGCIDGNLDKQKISFRKGAAICVVLASQGYPGNYKKGEIIQGLNTNRPNTQIFHAGTQSKNDKIVTNGGRVLGITSCAKNIKNAIKQVYSIIGKNGVHFKNMQFRNDIGKKGLIP